MPNNRGFSKAQIRRRLTKPATTIVVTGEDLNQLLSFFPTIGEKKETGWGGAWIAGYEVTFFRKDGSAHSVTIDSSCHYWTEGHGDHLLRERLQDFLTKEHKPRPSTTHP